MFIYILNVCIGVHFVCKLYVLCCLYSKASFFESLSFGVIYVKCIQVSRIVEYTICNKTDLFSPVGKHCITNWDHLDTDGSYQWFHSWAINNLK